MKILPTKKQLKRDTPPLFLSKIPAGFPSPADDYKEDSLNINDYIVQNPASTFFVKVTGDSMIDAGIFPDDILVVDRSLPIKPNKIVIAIVDGEFTVKRLLKEGDTWILSPENKTYSPIKLTEDNYSFWGVVTYTIHKTV